MPRPRVHFQTSVVIGAAVALGSFVARRARQSGSRPDGEAFSAPFADRGEALTAQRRSSAVDQGLVDAAELGAGIVLGGTLTDLDHLLVVLTDKLGMARGLIPWHGLEWPLALFFLTRGRASLLGIPTPLVRGWAIGMILHVATDVRANPKRRPDLSLLYRVFNRRIARRMPPSPGTEWVKQPFWTWI